MTQIASVISQLSNIIVPNDDIFNELFIPDESGNFNQNSKIKAFCVFICTEKISLREKTDVPEQYQKLHYAMDVATRMFGLILSKERASKEVSPETDDEYDIDYYDGFDKVINHIITLL